MLSDRRLLATERTRSLGKVVLRASESALRDIPKYGRPKLWCCVAALLPALVGGDCGSAVWGSTIRFADHADTAGASSGGLVQAHWRTAEGTPAAQDLIRLTASLGEEREQTDQTFQSIGRSDSHTSSAATASPLSRSQQVLDKAERENMAAYVRIIRQLDAVESLLATQERALAEAASAAASSSDPPAESSAADVTTSEQSDVQSDVPVPSATSAADSATVEIHDEVTHETHSGVDTPTPHVPQPLTQDILSREQMADSLFAAGETQAALNLYQDLLQGDPAPEDAAWFHYQAATCARRLGDTDTAARHLRIVAGQAQVEALADYAKWWLDSFEVKRLLHQSLSQLNAVIETAEEPK